MATRNANHMGGITYIEERAKTKPWRVRLMRDGEVHVKHFKTQEEAIKYKNQIATRDVVPQKTGSSVAFSVYAEQWIAKKGKLKRGSLDTLQGNLRNHVNKYVGMLPIDQIDNRDMERMIYGLLDEGFSLAIIKKCQYVITACLKKAAADKVIKDVPVFSVEMPSIEQYPQLKEKEMQWLDETQMKAYVKECYRTYSNDTLVHFNGPMFALLLHTGIRMGELFGLTWNDYDRVGYTLLINKNVASVSTGNKKGEGPLYEKIVQNSPKTQAGVRKIKLNKEAVKDLIAIEKLTGKFEHIACNKKGGLLNSGCMYQSNIRILTNAGLPPMGVHSLRHSYVTYMYNKGIAGIAKGNKFDPKALAAEIGHADVRTMYDIYTHLDKNIESVEERKFEDLNDF